MGQVQSDDAGAHQSGNWSSSSSSSLPDQNSSQPQPRPSMESLIAEAVAFGNDENESLDAKAQKALDCPCIADLRNGPCGTQFSEAFLCFLKSTAEEKGSDCVHPFVALQNCIKVNPDAFSKDILDDDDDEEEVNKKEVRPTQDYKIIPPVWMEKPQSPKQKL